MHVNTRYGLIGCGMMGQEHVRNIALIGQAEVAAILEPDEGMRERARRLAPAARMAFSIEELLAKDDLDCLIIASPNHFHAAQFSEIAAIRPLPLLLEKPVCVSLDEAVVVKSLAADYPFPIWVAMEYRYMPPIARLIETMHQATGGIRLLSMREHRFPFLEKVGNWNRFNRNTGGTLVEKCCHFFDLVRLMTTSEPMRIYASGAQDHNHRDEIHEGERPDILDNAYVTIDFVSGQRAMVELSMFAEGSTYQEEISIAGPAGKIECFVPGPHRFWPVETLGHPPVAKVLVSPRSPRGTYEIDVPVDRDLLEAGDHNGATYYQHRHFLKALKGEIPVEVTIEDGLKAVVMGLAAHHSIETGQAIDLTKPPYAAFFGFDAPSVTALEVVAG